MSICVIRNTVQSLDTHLLSNSVVAFSDFLFLSAVVVIIIFIYTFFLPCSFCRSVIVKVGVIPEEGNTKYKTNGTWLLHPVLKTNVEKLIKYQLSQQYILILYFDVSQLNFDTNCELKHQNKHWTVEGNTFYAIHTVVLIFVYDNWQRKPGKSVLKDFDTS